MKAAGQEEVRVMAPARLHLGFLDLHGGLGRKFGSLGLAIEGIATRLRVLRSVRDDAQGPDAARALAALHSLREAWRLPPAHVEIEEAVPAHAGLGSGTQLRLALGLGLARLHGRPASLREIASLLDRGNRSGIGIGAFETGGFLVDGGKGPQGDPPPILARLAFPQGWRLVLIFDDSHKGLSGAAEREAFARLPAFKEACAGHLCRLLLMRLLPGLAERDLDAVGRALGEIQRIVGDHFALAQGGGRFASALVSDVLQWLEGQGIPGIGQSSWGPTGFALVGNEEDARLLEARLEERFHPAWPSLRFAIVAGRNQGGEVT
jgi:beta-ribofuranosylaminobenzene 5'-phosphate synthase